MFCPSCGATAQAGQKFCTTCGASLALVATQPPSAPLPPPAATTPTSVTTTMPATPAAAAPAAATSAAAAPAATVAPTAAPTTNADTAAPTAALKVVEQTIPLAYAPQPAITWSPAATGAWPVEVTGQHPVVATTRPFVVTPLVVIAFLAGVAGVLGVVLKLYTQSFDGAPGQLVTAKATDISDTNLVAALIAALAMVAGASFGATGRRLGSGFAAGAGLALAGLAGINIALVVSRIDAFDNSISAGTVDGVLTTTYEAGIYVLAGAAVLGLLTFVMAFGDAGPDGRRSLDPFVCGIGALASIALAFGPLIPMHGTSFAANFDADVLPPLTIALRIGALLLVAVAGLVGFLSRRRWGIGAALGGACVAAWQWATSFPQHAGGDRIGFGGFPTTGANPGATDLKPHAVTTIGLVVVVVCAAAALAMGAQRRRADTVPA